MYNDKCILHGNKYGAILIDPPWSFKTYSGKSCTPHRSANDHYETATLSDIAAFPVARFADKNCALFMWVVDSHLDVSLDLINIWGFNYKSIAFQWRKETKTGKARIGMGYWTRKQAEICLLATRGTPKRQGKGVRQLIECEDWICAKRREHSRKPDEQYGRIENLVDGPYLEMCARQTRSGWDSWGDQVGKFDSQPVISRCGEE